MPHLLSFKPYLFYAYYNWFISSGITPHLMVNTSVKGVEVPMDYVHDHRIVLSIAESAVKDFCAGPNSLTFKATFAGHSETIIIPYDAMEQLIAKETNMAIPLGAALAALDISDSQQTDDENEDDEDSGVEFVSDETVEKPDDNNEEEGISSGFEFVDDDHDDSKK
ncbi:MAG TPA: hypothetical protein DCL74_02355 [Succinivibrionaceae bacterium]|nr:hypothetical protein [Succinivibrionaceae bacterium]